jgi:hypothetical protein
MQPMRGGDRDCVVALPVAPEHSDRIHPWVANGRLPALRRRVSIPPNLLCVRAGSSATVRRYPWGHNDRVAHCAL